MLIQFEVSEGGRFANGKLLLRKIIESAAGWKIENILFLLINERF